VYFGASDPKGGAAGSLVNLFELPEIFRVQSQGGICAEECSALLSEFFASLRRARQQK
jgi:tRNA(adenine34) deaminase